MSPRAAMRARLLAWPALAVVGCSFGIQGVDPKWDGKTEPVCSSAAVTVDRVLGVSLLIAAAATLGQNRDEVSAAVSAPFAGLGMLYWFSAFRGAQRVSECQRVRAQWRNSNMIKPIAAAPPAQASVSSAPTSRPWAAGVSEAEQAVALELYVAGNHDFVEHRYPEAVTSYKRALAHWDHPAIRFNLAVCLLELGLPVAARGHLERSLAYGVSVLGAEAYAQALAYRARLDRQLVRLTLDCPEPGEEILLDGERIFVGPGQVTRFVLPGEHQVVASKRGYLPATKRIVLVMGQPQIYQIRLDPGAAP